MLITDRRMNLLLKDIKTMSKKWETKSGDYILYSDLKNNHLLSILKYVEKRAKDGMTLKSGGGHYLDDLWYDETEIKGKEVLDYYGYKGLIEEVKKRNLVYSITK